MPLSISTDINPTGMPTNVRLAREQCEKAFAAYLAQLKTTPPTWWVGPCPLADPVDVQIFIRKGEFDADGLYQLDKPDEIPLPCVAIAVPRVKPHESMGYPICELHVMVLQGIDEADVNARQSARFGFIAELFDDSHQLEVFAALNLSNPDRAVKNFNVFGMYQTEDMGKETARHWIDHLVYEVHCQPTDDVDGDSKD